MNVCIFHTYMYRASRATAEPSPYPDPFESLNVIMIEMKPCPNDIKKDLNLSVLSKDEKKLLGVALE